MNKSKYNLTIAPLWFSKSRKTMSMGSITIGVEVLKKLTEEVKEGGQFVIKLAQPEWKKNAQSPDAYLEYMTKADVETQKLFKAQLRDQHTRVEITKEPVREDDIFI